MGMKKPNNVIRIPTSLEGKFFKFWFTFLQPFHNLTPKEIDVISGFVKHRYLLSQKIKDEELLDKVVFSGDIRKKVRTECNMPITSFQVIMCNLKKKKVIVDGKINKKFIPNIAEEKGMFQLVILFDLNDEK